MRRMTERAARRMPGEPDVLELDVNDDEHFADLARELSRPLGRGGRRRSRDRIRARRCVGRQLRRRAARERLRRLRDQCVLAQSSGRGTCATDDREQRIGPAGGAPSSASTSTPPSHGRPTTGWVSRRPRSNRSHGTWRATSAQRGSGSTSSPRGPSPRRPHPGSPASVSLRKSGPSLRRWAGISATPSAVADAAIFLLSDLSRAISGEILHADGGVHAVGVASPTSESLARAGA